MKACIAAFYHKTSLDLKATATFTGVLTFERGNSAFVWFNVVGDLKRALEKNPESRSFVSLKTESI